MHFEWRHYLVLAEALAQGPDEAHWRSAISRAYYAAYNHARLYVIRRLSLAVPPVDGHKFVWDALKLGAGRLQNELSAAHNGRTLRHDRNQADYESKLGGDARKNAQDAIRKSRRIIESLPLN